MSKQNRTREPYCQSRPLKREARKKCETCGIEIKDDGRTTYCSRKCRPKTLNSNPRGVATGTLGSIAELAVGVELMRKGYHVFRALSSHGPADLVALKGSEVRIIEVRTGHLNTKGVLSSFGKRCHETATEVAVYVPEDRSIHFYNVHPYTD